MSRRPDHRLIAFAEEPLQPGIAKLGLQANPGSDLCVVVVLKGLVVR